MENVNILDRKKENAIKELLLAEDISILHGVKQMKKFMDDEGYAIQIIDETPMRARIVLLQYNKKVDERLVSLSYKHILKAGFA